jgi:hypothetical protein
MYKYHIELINKNMSIDLLRSNLTTYRDYKLEKNIKEIPEWYVITAGTRNQKIFAIYDNSIDIIGVLLIDL